MTTTNVPFSASLSLEVLQQFRVIFGATRRHFRMVEERCGLPGSQMWLLQEVQRNPGIGVSDLAVCLGIHQSTCSLLVDKLAARRFLKKERKASDLRCVGLALGEEAEKVLALLPGPAEGVLMEALSSIPEVALKTLNINLNELVSCLRGRDEYFACAPLSDQLRAGLNHDWVVTKNSAPADL